jgi:hypothetical protein
MRLRANALNLQLVAELPMSKQVEAVTGKPQRTITIFQFCDAVLAKDLIDVNMDFSIYMPCRIALIEDAKGQGWLVMMDVNVDAVAQEKRLPALKRIEAVRKSLIEIMQAGARRLCKFITCRPCAGAFCMRARRAGPAATAPGGAAETCPRRWARVPVRRVGEGIREEFVLGQPARRGERLARAVDHDRCAAGVDLISRQVGKVGQHRLVDEAGAALPAAARSGLTTPE